MHSWNPASSFLCSPPPSPPKFPQASRFPSDKKPGLSAGRAVQTNFHALPEDATGCIIPSLPLASGSPNKSLSPSDCATDPNASDLKANALPTPRPSLELPQRSHLLSLSEVISKIKPLLEQTSVIGDMSIKGVTSDVVEELLATSRAGELPGWEKLRYHPRLRSINKSTYNCITGLIFQEKG